jgi:hypothetical protein
MLQIFSGLFTVEKKRKAGAVLKTKENGTIKLTP